MKKILASIAIAGLLASCKDKTTAVQSISAADSTRIYEEQKAKENKQVAPATVVYKKESSNAAQTTTQKKGWSSAAKGTAIGAGAGAITGAIISKKKGKGALIGGIVGAGGGYIIGRSKDKRSGRVQQ